MKENNSRLQVISGKDANGFEEKGSEFQTSYFKFIYDAPIIIPLVEIADDDLIRLADKHGEFAYLDSPDEDIYTLSDGTPL